MLLLILLTAWIGLCLLFGPMLGRRLRQVSAAFPQIGDDAGSSHRP